MRQLLYSLIYNKHLNCIIRNIIKPFKNLLPESLKIHPSGTLRLRSGEAKITIATNQTNYVTTIIFWEGYERFEYTRIFCDLIKNVSSFYDIGANIGYYSLLAASLNPKIEITSFEAADGPLYYFRNNIDNNKLSNIILEPIAVSDTNGEVEFIQYTNPKYPHLKYNLGGTGHIGTENSNLNITKKKVQSTTLDDYVKSSGNKKIDLIKIDTEGNEDLILSRSQDIMRNMKPIIICEILYNKIESRIEEIASSHDYLFYNHYIDGLRRVKTLKRTYDDGVRNCFLVHPSKIKLIEKYISE
jgi:FkbM family methyltransferase